MKKNAACLAAIMTLISLTACSNTAKNNYYFTENALSTITHDTEVTDNVTKGIKKADEVQIEKLDSTDYVLSTSFTPIYNNVNFLDIPATGSVKSYEELQEYMNAYEDISFVEYEITSQYTPKEAYAKTGDKIFLYSTTLYQAHIYITTI